MSPLYSKDRWPLVIFLAAFLIRLIYLLQFRSSPYFYFPMVDEQWHYQWAKEIIGGNFWGSEAYFRGPLYPYLLAFLLKITGDSIFWSRLLQMILPSISASLIYLIGRLILSKEVGIIAGLGFALYGTMIFYDAMFLIESLFITLNLWGIYLMLKCHREPSLKIWALTGLIFGLSAITRPNILLLTPLFLLWIYMSLSEIRERFKRLALPGIFLLAMMIPILGVTLRNYLVTGEAILISSQGGVNLYIGNNPDAEGLTMLMPELELDESLPWTEFTAATRAAAEKEAGRTLTAGEESSFWSRKAWRFIAENPGKFLGLTFKKLVYLCVGFENSDNQDIYFSRQYSSLYAALLWKKIIYFPYGLLFPLALAGIFAGWRLRKELSLLYLFTVGYIPTIILFLVTARHRLPLVPFLLIFAAFAITESISLLKSGQVRKFAIISGIFLAAVVLSNRTYFDIGFSNISQMHFNLGLAYEKQGNLAMAEREYKKALEDNPQSATTLNNLGFVQFRLGKLDDAQAQFERAIRSEPQFAEAYNNLGLIMEARQELSSAELYYKKAINIEPELYQGYLNLGDLYLAQDNLVMAELYYLQAREVAPKRKEIYFKLGGLYGRKQEFDKAEKIFREGAALGEPSAGDLVNWGNIYFATSQPEQAIGLYKRAIEKDSNFLQGYFNLALTFNNYGYPIDSTRVYLEKALRINPQFAPARELLGRLGQ
jgi:tetratricopeptide (TPR) repeat protein